MSQTETLSDPKTQLKSIDKCACNFPQLDYCTFCNSSTFHWLIGNISEDATIFAGRSFDGKKKNALKCSLICNKSVQQVSNIKVQLILRRNEKIGLKIMQSIKLTLMHFAAHAIEVVLELNILLCPIFYIESFLEWESKEVYETAR